MYSLNEKVVYPGHGVARINRIVEKKIGNDLAIFFELKFLDNKKETTILIPVDAALSAGIRKLSSEDKINDIFRVFSEISPAKLGNFNSWNKRRKQYLGKLGSGDLIEISKIYRDLQFLSKNKDLSFGERKLLEDTEKLLVQEISLVKNILEKNALEKLRSFFNNPTINVIEPNKTQVLQI